MLFQKRNSKNELAVQRLIFQWKRGQVLAFGISLFTRLAREHPNTDHKTCEKSTFRTQHKKKKILRNLNLKIYNHKTFHIDFGTPVSLKC